MRVICIRAKYVLAKGKARLCYVTSRFLAQGRLGFFPGNEILPAPVGVGGCGLKMVTHAAGEVRS